MRRFPPRWRRCTWFGALIRTDLLVMITPHVVHDQRDERGGPSPASGPRHNAERGFALLIVLWTLTLLTMLTSGLAASGRGEVKLAENLRGAAVAGAAADGAVQEAIFRLVAGQWKPGPMPHQLRLGDAIVMVRMQDEADLVNPNNAPIPLFAALLREVGADARTALTLAGAVNAFRDAGGADRSPYVAAGLPYGPALRDFRDVAELRLVAGMPAALYARLAPHLSVWKGPLVVPDAADPVVAAAFRDAGPNGGFEVRQPAPGRQRIQDDSVFVRITAAAAVNAARFDRIAEVQIFGQAGGQPQPPPYQIMSWSSVDD
jgi:general secretion pathway protein K